FILNKVDLLTAEECEQVDRFIGDILMTQLRQPEKPRLFHICARQAENARRQSPSDPQWTSSGMEAVRSDILTFMAREKYFTLSQALTEKLNEAIHNIVALLQNEKNDFEAPLITLNRERDALARERAAIGTAVEKDLALIPAEKKAMMKFLDEQLAAGRPKLSRQVRDAVSILLDSSTCDGRSLKGVTAALTAVIPQAFSAFETRLLAQLNRPLKKALLLHGKEFGAIVQSMHSCIAGIGELPENRLQEKIDALEIDLDESYAIPKGDTVPTITLRWNDRFYRRRSRVKRLHERYDPRCDEALQSYFFSFSMQVRRRIDTLFSSLDKLLAAEYRLLSDQLDRVMKHKERSIAEKIELNNRAATKLTALIESFQRIAGRLH
ncbi:MAG: hypothetical protein JXA18_03665, partial [Chitinispirillaceae bacterium]|nr:hypothetical protein [Chitinispirillaceae bacterium]